MSRTTKSKEKTELIIGLCTISAALLLLVALVIGMGRLSSQIEVTKPPQKDPTVQTTTAAPTTPSLRPNPYSSRDFAYENGYITCLSGPSMLGVDVSEYQGVIDWNKVASKNVQVAMVRMGARAWGKTGEILTDSRWEENLSGARAAGLKVGVYFFSQAISIAEAQEEARCVLDLLQGQELDMPIVFDWEIISSEGARTANISAEMLNSCAIAFCEEIKAAGYEPMVYFNIDLTRQLLDLQKMQDMGYRFWLAMYNSSMTFPYRIDMWQYTSGGTVPGIEGLVDLNVYFIYE